MLEISFPTIKTKFSAKLVTLKLKDGYRDSQKNGFKRKVSPELFVIPSDYKGKVKRFIAELDLYPKIEVLSVKDSTVGDVRSDKQKAILPTPAMAFFDWDRLYLRLLEYKNQKSWLNLRLSLTSLRNFASGTQDWYELLAPPDKVQFMGFEDIKRLEEIIFRLLCQYVDRYYEALKSAYEDKFYEYAEVATTDLDGIDGYSFEVRDDSEGNLYYARLGELKKIVESGDIGRMSAWNGGYIEAIVFERHVFQPLLNIPDKKLPIVMRPLAFDATSEVTFVRDLQKFYDSTEGKTLFAGKDIYLLRNAASKSKGIGFGSAGNFYPDFLLWVVDGDTQYLSFVDPKGIHHLDLSDAKFQLYKNIKEIEMRLANPKVVLNAFILSETRFTDVLNKGSKTPEDFEMANILWMQDDQAPEYLRKMFGKVLG